MPWSFSGERPIYTQLVEQLQIRIVTGTYPPASRLPSVRELAEEAAVNPNTMQRALSELENRGLVFSQRTAGRFVTEDARRITLLRRELAEQKIGTFLREMERLGYSAGEIRSLLEQKEDKAT